jgi:hypothetical protein
MAIEAVTLGAVMKEFIAAGSLGGIGILAAELENVFSYIPDLLGGKKSPTPELLDVILGTILWIVSQHVGL